MPSEVQGFSALPAGRHRANSERAVPLADFLQHE